MGEKTGPLERAAGERAPGEIRVQLTQEGEVQLRREGSAGA